ncbi:single-stranded DNA-binding protein [Sediminibacterium roseum]|nr:single-stranded DNA-binding protein [Sediminibacterium roseum]
MRNKVQLIGNVGQLPEIRTIADGKRVANFSVSTTESYKNAKGEKVTDTQWHNVVAWGRLADVAEQFLEKGTEVGVEGKLINRSYTDKQGTRRLITEVQANELLVLTKKH